MGRDGFPQVCDVGAGMWSDTNVTHLLTHKVVPLDAIVIRREELPAVTKIDGPRLLDPDGATISFLNDTPESLRRLARYHLAGAEYLTAHPPVDEAQVSALTAVFYRLPDAPAPDDAAAMARELVARGVRVVTP
jgi:hypothetical protein